jgi:hypothetical protein
MALFGGELVEDRTYPVRLKLQNSKIDCAFAHYTEVVEWRTKELDIKNRLKAIRLKDVNVRVAITNEAPGLSHHHEGLGHFAGYYATFTVGSDDQITVSAEETHDGPHFETAGAGNCVPNAQLP